MRRVTGNNCTEFVSPAWPGLYRIYLLMNVTLCRFLYKVRPSSLGAWLVRRLGIKREPFQAEEGTFFINPASHFGLSLLTTKKYEEDSTSDTVDRLLQPGMSFVDLGANEGYFSVMASRRVGPEGRVIAIEPQPRLQEVVQKNLELNQCQNAQLETIAVSDKADEVEFFLSPEMNTGSSGFTRSTRYKVPTVKVQTMPLAQAFAKFGVETVDVMKVDIEGHEYEAILGSKEVFEQKRVHHLILELHPWILEKRDLKADDITDFLKSCGYHRREGFVNDVFSHVG